MRRSRKLRKPQGTARATSWTPRPPHRQPSRLRKRRSATTDRSLLPPRILRRGSNPIRRSWNPRKPHRTASATTRTLRPSRRHRSRLRNRRIATTDRTPPPPRILRHEGNPIRWSRTPTQAHRSSGATLRTAQTSRPPHRHPSRVRNRSSAPTLQLLPPRKDRTIQLPLPPITTVPQIATAMSALVAAIGDGRITPTEGESLVNIFTMQTKCWKPPTSIAGSRSWNKPYQPIRRPPKMPGGWPNLRQENHARLGDGGVTSIPIGRPPQFRRMSPRRQTVTRRSVLPGNPKSSTPQLQSWASCPSARQPVFPLFLTGRRAHRHHRPPLPQSGLLAGTIPLAACLSLPPSYRNGSGPAPETGRRSLPAPPAPPPC